VVDESERRHHVQVMTLPDVHLSPFLAYWERSTIAARERLSWRVAILVIAALSLIGWEAILTVVYGTFAG
jgi:hypothetical protein